MRDLADASEETYPNCGGTGHYSRVRNLHKAAVICDTYGDRCPQTMLHC
ncbi:MAG: hypothetical protein ACLUB2_02890 [Butyricicoccus pullicaecorum]